MDVDDVAAGLRAVLAAIEAGEIEAAPGERAYLAGALDALDRVRSRTVAPKRRRRPSPRT